MAPSAKTDQHMCRIVRVLERNATVVVSGTKLAEELGVSRSEVWRLIEQLRHLGLPIAGHAAIGYQLEAIPDLLLPDALAPLVEQTRFGNRANIHHFFKTASTNAEAMQAAIETGDSRAPEGSVFVAEEQTAGRGRGDHNWHSERSAGIYLTVILRPPLAPGDVLILSLAAGLAVYAAVKEVTGLEADLKWPNDLLLGKRPESQKKFCGILAEMSAEIMRVRHVVVGIGINVNHARFPGELIDRATSLRIATGRTWSRVEVAAAVLRALDREYAALLAGGIAGRAEIIRCFEARSSMVHGRRIRVCSANERGDNVENAKDLTGVTAGLDDHGFLLLRTENGVAPVLAGSIELEN